MTRSSSRGWGRRAAIGSISALVVGASASIGAALSPSATPAAASQYANKVTICHHTHSAKHPFVTITVSRNALPAHLRHGDTIGPCSTTSTAETANASQARNGKAAKKGKKDNGAARASATHSGKAQSSPGHIRAPGRSETSPGNSGTAPGQVASPPGDSGTAPAQAPSPPGHSGTKPRQGTSPPGNSGTAPGHTGSAPGQGASPPGHSGSAPGQGGSPPGQGKQ